MRFGRGSYNNVTVKHKEFVQLYAEKMNCSEKNAEKYLAGFMDTIFDCMEKKSSITLTNFGKFYVSDRGESTAFRFNPAAKMKGVLGW